MRSIEVSGFLDGDTKYPTENDDGRKSRPVGCGKSLDLKADYGTLFFSSTLSLCF